jgi:hypothetical protein
MSDPYVDREFMIFNVSELNTINFNEVLETSEDTVRKSVDLTITFVKWNGDVAPCVVGGGLVSVGEEGSMENPTQKLGGGADEEVEQI